MLAEKMLLVETAPPAAIITLNRPDRRNALSLAVMRDLTGALEQVSRDPSVRAVILRANGPVFSAGHDLTELVGGSRQAYQEVFAAKIGLFCSTPMVAVSRAIGRKRALEMLLTGELVDAATAAEWGLVNRVVPADQLEAATRALAEKVASASPYTVGIGKEAFYHQIDLPQHAAYEHTRDVMVENTQAADAQEGITAFLAKRKPSWSGH